MTAPPKGVTVLGLDPGTRHFGWGVVRREGTRLSHVAHGVVHVEAEGALGDRLVAIERALVEVVRAHAPEEASIESLFFAKDPQSAAKLGHARGVALLVCARAGLASFEYPPARVKRTVAGSGAADKAQVAHMIRVMLGLSETPPADAADALAIAVTHLQGRSLLPAVHGPQGALSPGKNPTESALAQYFGRPRRPSTKGRRSP